MSVKKILSLLLVLCIPISSMAVTINNTSAKKVHYLVIPDGYLSKCGSGYISPLGSDTWTTAGPSWEFPTCGGSGPSYLNVYVETTDLERMYTACHVTKGGSNTIIKNHGTDLIVVYENDKLVCYSK